jgi:hypothetical protein
MVQERKAQELEQWLLDAQNSGVEELKNFPRGSSLRTWLRSGPP